MNSFCRIVAIADKLRLSLFLVICEQFFATYDRRFEVTEISTRKIGAFDVFAAGKGSGSVVPVSITVRGVGVSRFCCWFFVLPAGGVIESSFFQKF